MHPRTARCGGTPGKHFGRDVVSTFFVTYVQCFWSEKEVSPALQPESEDSQTATVVSFHVSQEVMDGDTYDRRVYVLKTDNGSLQVAGSGSVRTASKRPPLGIGQQITFRTDGKFIWTVLSDGKEYRYYIKSAV